MPVCSVSVFIKPPVPAFQIFIVESLLLEIILSFVKRTFQIEPVCPVSVFINLPELVAQILMICSLPADMMLKLSGENAMQYILPLCLSNEFNIEPLVASHILTFRSSPPDIIL